LVSGQLVTRRYLAVLAVIVTLVAAAPARAGHVLVDLLDAETLEQTEPTAAVAPDTLLDLLLVEVVRERVAAGALGYGTEVPVMRIGSDPGAAMAPHGRLAVGELLQLVLLTRSHSALATLVAAVGPGREQGRLRMRRVIARLALRDTEVPDDWPEEQSPASGVVPDGSGGGRKAAPASPLRHAASAHTTIGDVVRLATTIAQDSEIRRRLALDGAPIADGAVIVRATDPLITRTPPSLVFAPAAPTHDTVESLPAIAIEERDGLALLAVASGPEAPRNAWQALERGLARYRRVEVVRAGQVVAGEVGGRGGGVAHVTAVAAQSFALTVPRSGVFAIRAWLQLHADGEAPPVPNQSMGELVFEKAGRVIGAVPLVAPEPSAPSRWLDTASR
jgi:hypothetical protein